MLLVGSILAALGLIRRKSMTCSGHQRRERPRPVNSVRATSAALSLVLLIATASFASGSPLLTTINVVDSLNGSTLIPYCLLPAGCNGTANIIPSSGNFGGTFLNYATSETADFGAFTLSASGTLSVPQPVAIASSVTDVFAGAVALYQDQWTILGGTTGDAGSLLLTFAVSESSTATSSTLIDVFFEGRNTTTTQDFPGVSVLQSAIYVVTIPIILGQELDYELGMQTSVTLKGIADGGFNGQSATVDVNAVLTGIGVLDQGTPVPFTLTTASGSPNFNVSTPEPGTLFMLAGGLLSLTAKRRL
jgi:hypothetical protein